MQGANNNYRPPTWKQLTAHEVKRLSTCFGKTVKYDYKYFALDFEMKGKPTHTDFMNYLRAKNVTLEEVIGYAMIRDRADIERILVESECYKKYIEAVTGSTEEVNGVDNVSTSPIRINEAKAVERSIEKKESLEVDDLVICPITFERFEHPVETSCFHTIEKNTLEKWLSSGKSTCPLCYATLTSYRTNVTVMNLLGMDPHKNKVEVVIERSNKANVVNSQCSPSSGISAKKNVNEMTLLEFKNFFSSEWLKLSRLLELNPNDYRSFQLFREERLRDTVFPDATAFLTAWANYSGLVSDLLTTALLIGRGDVKNLIERTVQ